MDSSIQTLRLPLIRRNDRPSFELNRVIFLFDTGAHIPVWCSGEEVFRKAYPDSTKTGYVSRLSGFGKGYTEAEVFVIPRFSLENSGVKYEIINLYVAVTDYDSIKFDFILSSTMFSKADYMIANSEGVIKIQFANSNYICTPMSNSKTLNKITVWIQ